MTAFRFERFADEQREAIGMLLNSFLFNPINVKTAQDYYRQLGAGVLAFVFRTEYLDSMQPPVYLTWREYVRKPLVPASQLEDLRQELAAYDPKRHYLCLAVSPSDNPRVGLYAWWKMPVAPVDDLAAPSRVSRGR